MRTVRIFEPAAAVNARFALSPDGAGHLCRVLRFKAGGRFNAFDGAGNEVECELISSGPHPEARALRAAASAPESPLDLELGQVISRDYKMEFLIQKATELGVRKISPLMSERCVLRLGGERAARKAAQWRKIAISAAEQCGRSVLPEIAPLISLKDWCRRSGSGARSLTLDPAARLRLRDCPGLGPGVPTRLLVGPEGGLSAGETALAREQGFAAVSLGPRILRTETAALAALAILGSRFGDL